MEKTFKASVNGEFQYEFSNEEVLGLDTLALSPFKYHVLKDNRSFSAEVHRAGFPERNYEVQINANRYRVRISNDLDQLIEEMGLSAVASKSVNEVKAPMPGMILNIMAREGQEVKEGDFLLVLEAMKMENTLTAPRDGVVKEIHIQEGKTVDKNQLLLEFE